MNKYPPTPKTLEVHIYRWIGCPECAWKQSGYDPENPPLFCPECGEDLWNEPKP